MKGDQQELRSTILAEDLEKKSMNKSSLFATPTYEIPLIKAFQSKTN